MKNPLRSPAFRRWFGDSKVVDGRGKPLVVYHGTPRGGFTSFRSGRRGLFFFTADRNVASSYIGPLADELLDSDFEAEPTPGVGQPPRKGVPGIYRVYLRLSNPLVFDADGRGFDEIYPEAIGLEGQDDLTVDEIAEMARQQGYDGLIVRNLYDTGLYSDYTEPSTVYVAFDPRQIKSATVQRGTYDPDSTDIRENPRANQKKTLTVQDTPAFQQWFRGSKVVDQDGRPLIMYHGTPKADFTVFREGRHAFFTTSLATAQSYGKAEKVPLLKKIPGKAAPGVYAVYLRIENPLVVEAGGREHYEIRTRAVPVPREDIARVLATTWVPPELSTEQIAVVAERLGYDGVIFHDLLDDSGGDWGNFDAEPSTVCAVFSPAQVKSATGNRGTYDPRSLDIRENVSSTTGRHPDLDSLVLYHGAQRWEGPPRLQPAGKNKSENGSGLYLTTNPDTARRYAKGGGSVLIFELDPDLRWADQVRIPHQEVLLFLRALPRLKHRDRIEADLAKYEPVGVPAFVLENLMLFHGALVGDKGPALALFFVASGIDAGHTRFSGEDYVVLYNLDKIRSYRKVSAKESLRDSPRLRSNPPCTLHKAGERSRFGFLYERDVFDFFMEHGIHISDYEEPFEVCVDEHGHMIGASTFGCRHEEDEGCFEYSFSVAVDPDARRSGVARRLVKSIIDQHPGINLAPWVVNPHMVLLLESMGFEADGEWSQDNPYMRLWTPAPRANGARPNMRRLKGYRDHQGQDDRYYLQQYKLARHLAAKLQKVVRDDVKVEIYPKKPIGGSFIMIVVGDGRGAELNMQIVRREATDERDDSRRWRDWTLTPRGPRDRGLRGDFTQISEALVGALREAGLLRLRGNGEEAGVFMHWVHGPVTATILPQQDGVVIYEWQSSQRGETASALRRLREKYGRVHVCGIGQTSSDPSWRYWQHMLWKGLVDSLEDDEGHPIGRDPAKARPNISFDEWTAREARRTLDQEPPALSRGEVPPRRPIAKGPDLFSGPLLERPEIRFARQQVAKGEWPYGSLDGIIARVVGAAVEALDGNVRAASRALEISHTTTMRWLRTYRDLIEAGKLPEPRPNRLLPDQR